MSVDVHRFVFTVNRDQVDDAWMSPDEAADRCAELADQIGNIVDCYRETGSGLSFECSYEPDDFDPDDV